MIEFEFKWPPKECNINGNASLHWSVKGKARKKYREECFILAKQKIHSEWIGLSGNGPWKTTITFFPRSNKGDIDNMLSSCKGMIDGMSDALGINDNTLRPMILDVGGICEEGKILVRID